MFNASRNGDREYVMVQNIYDKVLCRILEGPWFETLIWNNVRTFSIVHSFPERFKQQGSQSQHYKFTKRQI